MTLLKNTVIGIAIIAFLAILKFILDKLSPLSAPLHDLLILDYQLAVFLWIILSLLLKLFF